MSASFRSTIKLARQALVVVLRDRRQLGRLLLAVSDVFNIDCFPDRRFLHQLFDLILVLNRLTVKTKNHVATDEPRLIRRSTRSGDRFEHHALVWVIESINADVRLIDRSAGHDVRALAQRSNQRGERSSTNEEHEQSDEDPRHAAHPAFLLLIRGQNGSGRVTRSKVLVTAGVTSHVVSQSESAIPAES